jgi:hypothetical protein
MRALSIRQPWAWLITRPDITVPLARQEAYRLGLIKDVENRTWQTKLRGRFAIQAALSVKRAPYERLMDEIEERHRIAIPSFREISEMTGGIVGTANLVDCLREYDSTWKEKGTYGFVLTQARPVEFIPYLGRLSFFDIRRQDVLDALGEQGNDMVVNPFSFGNKGGRISRQHHNNNTQQRGPHPQYVLPATTQNTQQQTNPTHKTDDAETYPT